MDGDQAPGLFVRGSPLLSALGACPDGFHMNHTQYGFLQFSTSLILHKSFPLPSNYQWSLYKSKLRTPHPGLLALLQWNTAGGNVVSTLTGLAYFRQCLGAH